MLQFILGGAGVGKSYVLYQQVKQDLSQNRKVLVLVPEHQVLETEKALIHVSNGAPTLQLEVLSFSRLAQRVFRTLGGMTQREIDRGAQLLVLWRAMEEVAPFLQEFSQISLQEQGFLERTLDTISEFKNNCISQQELALIEPRISDVALRKKIADFSKIYTAFDAILIQEYQYDGNDLARAYDRLSENAVFKDFYIYIDSFVGFTAQEMQLIAELMRHGQKTTIALPQLNEDVYYLQEAKRTKKALEKIANRIGVQLAEPIYLEQQYEKNPALCYLCDHLWKMDTAEPTFEKNQLPQLYLAENLFEEVELVAQKISDEVRKGREYREIAVATRNLSRYDGILESVFSEYQIPFFLSRQIELQKKPFIRWMQSALNVICNHFRLQDMMAYMRSPYLMLEAEDYDLLERYVTVWNIQGDKWLEKEPWTMNPDGFTDHVHSDASQKLNQINALRHQLIAPLHPLYLLLTSKCNVKEAIISLYHLAQDLKIPLQLQKENAAESNLIWNTWLEAIDQLYRVCGDQEIKHPRQFLQMLNLILSQANLRDIPSFVDGVLIGDASQIQAPDIKSVYLIGVTAEQFPSSPASTSLFSVWERKDILATGLELLQSEEIDIARELYYAYRAVALPKEQLTLSGYTANASTPSELFDRVGQIFSIQPILVSGFEQEDFQVQSKKPAWQYYCANRTSLQGKALERFFEIDPEYQTKLQQIKMFRSDESIRLSEKTTKKLYPDDLALTQSRLEQFVRCPFAFHCQYTLRLSPSAGGRFQASDSGTFMHRLLERVVARIQEMPDGFASINENAIEKMVKEEVQQYLIACCGNHESASIRLQNLFRRLQRNATLLIKNLVKEFAQSQFYPAFFELQMTKDETASSAKTLEITLPDDTKVQLYGIIDRVDLYQKENDVYIRVVDYKTGSQEHRLDDIRYGLNLQMLIYLFALWKNPPEILKKRVGADDNTDFFPAGVLYFTAKPPKITSHAGILSPEVYEEMLQIPRSGWLLDQPDVLKAMEADLQGKFIPVSGQKKGSALHTLEDFGVLYRQVCDIVSEIAKQLKSGIATATPEFVKNHCEYCAYQDICRKGSPKK